MLAEVLVKTSDATRSRRQLQSLVLLGVTLCLVGCGSGDRPDLGQVRGTVTLDGEPLPEAYVTFIQRGFRPSTGVTDANGNYELKYLRDASGASVGTNLVRINKESGAEGEPVVELLPDRYHRESTIERVVEPGQNVFDFELISDE